MNTGEVIRDGQGHSYEVGPLLGRGLWGKTYSVRTEDGMEWALKVPLSPKDLPTGHEKLAQISRKILMEMGDILSNNKIPQLMTPRLAFTTKEGVPCLLFHKNENNLERRLNQECTMREIISICVQLIEALDALPLTLSAHGNIHPKNVFLTERGSVQLSDPITPTLAKNYKALRAAKKFDNIFAPPEVRKMEIESPQQVYVDTYSVSMILFQSALDNKKGTMLPPEGLSKALRAALQDKVQNRLKEEGSNPRFHARLGAALSRFLNRALSPQNTPSPPFRFHHLQTYRERLQFLHDLIDPTVTYVGQILLDRSPGVTTFTTSEAVKFSCTIDCAPKIENFEEILCGIRLFDRSKEERIKGSDSEYTVDPHPTGRLRFGFTMRDLPPAQYLVQLAFKIRDAGSEPKLAEGEFDIHPSPGWVPPRQTPEKKPIPITIPAQDDSLVWSAPPSEPATRPKPPIIVAQTEPEPQLELLPQQSSPSVQAQYSEDEDSQYTEGDSQYSEEYSEDLSEELPDMASIEVTESPSKSPLIVNLSSTQTEEETDDDSEAQYMGPNPFNVKWNGELPHQETTGALDLESQGEDSFDSLDDAPTLFSTFVNFFKKQMQDDLNRYIIIGVGIVIVLLLIFLNLN